jgi:glycosyltransferase involved in cell wall biosynthesis
MFKPDPSERKADELGIYTSSAWAAFPAKGMRYVKQAIEGTPYNVKLMTNLTRDQVATGLKRADIYIFPSVYEETWGLCLNEAMASGCACITTDNAGGRAQVEDGVTGLIVKKRDPDGLRAAIMRLAEDKELRARLGANARAHVLEDHTLEAMGRRYIAIYEAEIARHK